MEYLLKIDCDDRHDETSHYLPRLLAYANWLVSQGYKDVCIFELNGYHFTNGVKKPKWRKISFVLKHPKTGVNRANPQMTLLEASRNV